MLAGFPALLINEVEELSMSLKIKTLSSLLLGMVTISAQAGMSGDWWGSRSKLEQNGIEIGLSYQSDFVSNINGGVSISGDLIDTRTVGLNMDMQTLLGWKNTYFYISYLYSNGGDVSAIVGSAGVSGLESGIRGGKIYEAWIDTRLGLQNSLRIGLYDLNSEFDVVPAAGLFVNGAFGMGNDIAQSGSNGPSIYPVPGMGLRYQTRINQNGYFQLALLEGDPGTGSPRFSWASSEGFLLVLEGGVEDGGEDAMQGKAGFGGWIYSAQSTTDAAAQPITASYNYGVYLLLNGALMYEGDKTDQGLSGFMRLGVASPLVNAYSAFSSAGLVYTGLVPGMDQDQLGIAMLVNLASDHYSTVMAGLATPVTDHEVIVEFSYRNQISADFYVQPFMQKVYNPGLDPAVNDAKVFGVRMGMEL
jgi:porin